MAVDITTCAALLLSLNATNMHRFIATLFSNKTRRSFKSKYKLATWIKLVDKHRNKVDSTAREKNGKETMRTLVFNLPIL